MRFIRSTKVDDVEETWLSRVASWDERTGGIDKLEKVDCCLEVANGSTVAPFCDRSSHILIERAVNKVEELGSLTDVDVTATVRAVNGCPCTFLNVQNIAYKPINVLFNTLIHRMLTNLNLQTLKVNN